MSGNIKELVQRLGVVTHALTPALRRQEKPDTCEFEASPVYIESLDYRVKP